MHHLSSVSWSRRPQAAGDADGVALLARHGASTRASDLRGKLPLDWACESAQPEVVVSVLRAMCMEMRWPARKKRGKVVALSWEETASLDWTKSELVPSNWRLHLEGHGWTLDRIAKAAAAARRGQSRSVSGSTPAPCDLPSSGDNSSSPLSSPPFDSTEEGTSSTASDQFRIADAAQAPAAATPRRTVRFQPTPPAEAQGDAPHVRI